MLLIALPSLRVDVYVDPGGAWMSANEQVTVVISAIAVIRIFFISFVFCTILVVVDNGKMLEIADL